MTSSTMWTLGVLGIYMILMLIIGWYSSKKVKNSTDYIVAGRRLPLWLTTATLFATWFGGGTAMGGASMAYSFGLRGVLMDPIGASVCLFLSGFFFMRTLRKLRYITIVDLFTTRYGKKVGLVASIVQTVAYMGWTGSLLMAFGTVLHSFTNVSFFTGVIIATLITLIYTYLGGMWAVSYTDAIQMLLLTLGFIIMLPLTISHLGGWSVVASKVPAGSFSIAPEAHWGYLGYIGIFGMVYYISSWVVQGMGSLTCQDMLQRALSSKNEATAVWASYFGGVLYIVIGLIPAFIGIMGTLVFPDLENTDEILPLMIQKMFSLPLTILFTVALIAAIMSSADSAILAPASIIAENIAPIINPKITEKGKLQAAKVSTIVIGSISMLIALYAKSIFFVMNVSWALLLVTLALPYIFAVYWKKTNAWGVLSSIGGSLITWLIFIHLTLPHCLEVEEGVMDCAIWDAIYISDIPALIVGLILIIAVSLLTQKTSKPKPLCDIDGNIMDVTFKEKLGLISIFKCKDSESK